MSDREMLELAAKAAGIEGSYGFPPNDYYYRELYRGNPNGILTTSQHGRIYVWNPLTDDGDALRLAVKLRIDVNHGDFMVVAEGVGAIEVGVAESKKPDPDAATRRAIVRAAAEIGRNMP